jgi:hypothetical protein
LIEHARRPEGKSLNEALAANAHLVPNNLPGYSPQPKTIQVTDPFPFLRPHRLADIPLPGWRGSGGLESIPAMLAVWAHGPAALPFRRRACPARPGR